MNRLAAATLGFGLLVTALGPDSALADRRVALVIGNSAYKNVSALPNPNRDAKSIAASFKSVGYNVVTATDVGIVEFRRQLRLFEETAASADIAVVFYAGHGIEVAGINYMIPVDAKLASDRDIDDEAIDLDRFLKSVNESKRLGLVMLDACRDNPFVPKMKQQRVSVARGVSSGRLSVVEPTNQNTLIAYAAKAGAVAEDGTNEHSPYTAALLNHLFEAGLDIRFALGRVRDDVRESTANRQEPFYTGSLGGTTIALVSAPEKPTAAAPDLEGQRRDYELVEKLGNKEAWEVFLRQHPTGFYSDLGRLQYDKLREAKAAEAGRQKEQREAERQRPEQEAARKRAEAAEAERQRIAQEAERKRAEEVRAAEAARDQRLAMRSDTGQSKGDIEAQTAQTNEDAVCRREAKRLAELQATKDQNKAREDLKRLARELICERLRPNVTAALEQMTQKHEPAARQQDRDEEGPARRQRAKRPEPEERKAAARHKDEGSGRQQRSKREEPRQAAEPEERKAAARQQRSKREEPRQASRPAPRQALSVPVGHSGGRGGAMVGVGF